MNKQIKMTPKVILLSCLGVIVFFILILALLMSVTTKADDTSNENELVTSTIIEGEQSDNPLLTCSVVVIDVLNGSGDTVIGKRAEVHTTKDVVDGLSKEQFHEFTENVVLNKGYSWFTINYDNGTGIRYVGAETSVIEYGSIDNEGIIQEVFEDIEY